MKTKPNQNQNENSAVFRERTFPSKFQYMVGQPQEGSPGRYQVARGVTSKLSRSDARYKKHIFQRQNYRLYISKNRKLNVDKKNRQTKNGKIGHRRPVLIMGEINWFGDGSWKLFIFYPGIINDDGKQLLDCSVENVFIQLSNAGSITVCCISDYNLDKEEDYQTLKVEVLRDEQGEEVS